jgi:hypothetical protein
MGQVTALNVMFGELSRRAAANMGEYLQTSELYLRMAFKAQNQCRMTLETLSNIKNPPVVYAKQANIANGPQQVNNGIIPSRGRADENKKLWSKAMKNGWTPQRKINQSQAIQRGKPWQKSIGPKLLESKAIVSQNACKGAQLGLRSRCTRYHLSPRTDGVSTLKSSKRHASPMILGIHRSGISEKACSTS